MSPDLENALAVVLTASVPVLGTFGAMALNKLRAKWGLQATAQNTANMESDIRTALNAGIARVLPTIETKGWRSSETREAILDAASSYLQARFPDRATAIVGQAVAISDSAKATVISQTLAARLPDAISVAAASPATPAAPDPHASFLRNIGP